MPKILYGMWIFNLTYVPLTGSQPNPALWELGFSLRLPGNNLLFSGGLPKSVSTLRSWTVTCEAPLYSGQNTGWVAIFAARDFPVYHLSTK